MSSNPTLRALSEQAAAAAAEHHYPALSWGIVRDGRLAECGGVGTLADGAAPDEHTVFRIASMTKSFTAAAVLALRDEGALRLDTPVAEYAPELASVRGPDDSPAITLRHLLSMTGGMPTDDPWADRHLDFTMDEIDEIYSAGTLFAFRTGDAWEYSNLGFGMIGRVVRRVTGRTVQEHISERFLGPLGMARTSWVQPVDGRCADPYVWRDDAHVPDLPHPVGDGEIAPMGGLWSTVDDLARWVAWLDAAHSSPAPRDATGLSAASRREMQRIQQYIGMGELLGRSYPNGYGFGLRVRDDAELGTVVAHSGGVPGYGTNMRWVAGTGVGAIALANTRYAPAAHLTMQHLYTLHEAGEIARPARSVSPELQTAADRLVALLNDWTDAAADALFSDNVAPDEPYARRAAEAARLVEQHGPLTVVAIHPDSATSGEAEVMGRTTHLRILVELSPLADLRIQAYSLPS